PCSPFTVLSHSRKFTVGPILMPLLIMVAVLSQLKSNQNTTVRLVWFRTSRHEQQRQKFPTLMSAADSPFLVRRSVPFSRKWLSLPSQTLDLKISSMSTCQLLERMYFISAILWKTLLLHMATTIYQRLSPTRARRSLRRCPSTSFRI